MFLTYLFYIMAVGPIMYEFIVLSKPVKYTAFRREITGKVKKKKKLSDAENAFCLCMLIYMIWSIVGVFSSQWLIFIAFFVLSLITSFLVSILNKRVQPVWIWIDALVSLGLLLFLILNKFHFHINIWQWLNL